MNRLLFHFACTAILSAGLHAQTPRTFRVWVFSDAHVGSDQKNGRESLATAIRQSEGPSGFQWDIALDLGDLSGAEGTPQDPEGEEVVRRFGALKQHRRAEISDFSGNHDRTTWIDSSGLRSAVGGPTGRMPCSWSRPTPWCPGIALASGCLLNGCHFWRLHSSYQRFGRPKVNEERWTGAGTPAIRVMFRPELSNVPAESG
jgi:hypothetical protein